MPVVSRVECTTFNKGGLRAYAGKDLRRHYREWMHPPGGNLDFKLVTSCDNANVPVTADYAYVAEYEVEDAYDEGDAVQDILDSCEYINYMCCSAKNNGQGMQHNTDVCHVIDDFGEIIECPGEIEGNLHCHGFG